jgi:single-strand DNA-binding protein
MYDTHITIVGNVLNPPEWRRTTNTNALVTTFKIASTARRLDRETGNWVDGNSLRVRVSCWRALASNVASSVMVGDPLIVTGRLYTRDWTDEEGNKRTQYELEATAIGHDLTRGKSRFERVKASTSTSAVEDAQARQRVGGEFTEPVPADQAPASFDDTPYAAADDEPVEAPITPVERPGPEPAPGGFPTDPPLPTGPDDLSPAADEAIVAGGLGPATLDGPEPVEEPGPRRRGIRRTKVPA